MFIIFCYFFQISINKNKHINIKSKRLKTDTMWERRTASLTFCCSSVARLPLVLQCTSQQHLFALIKWLHFPNVKPIQLSNYFCHPCHRHKITEKKKQIHILIKDDDI